MPNFVSQRNADELGVPVRTINLHLVLEKEETQHYCLFCRAGLYRSKYRVIAVIHGEGMEDEIVTAPIGIVCHKCSTRYYLQLIS